MEQKLDVTILEPKRKHPAIFEKFDELQKGQSFIIHNDHDPKPLYYQLLAERGKTFDWKYLIKGPEIWEVEIEKYNTGADTITVGEIASGDLRKIEVFRKFGIDFCCGGNKTLENACTELGLDVNTVQTALDETVADQKDTDTKFAEWEADKLIDHIVNKHHSYVIKELPYLLSVSAKVSSVHSETHPELRDIDKQIRLLNEELSAHLQKEERVLFPYIKQLVQAKKEGRTPTKPIFETVGMPIQIMESEHESAGEIIAEIKSLSNSYTVPESACNSYRLLFELLSDFEEDLNMHIHLENNILFPKSRQLESSYF